MMVAVKTSDAHLVNVTDPKIDNLHNVPTQNSANNIVIKDVVGNKTDTVGGNSLYSKSISIQDTVETTLLLIGESEGTEPVALPQTGQSSIFTITGVVEIVKFMGFVTTQIGAVANNMKAIANSTAGTDVDLCATVDVNADNVGTIYSLTGTLANAMVKTAGNGAGNTGAFESQSSGITVTAGTIDINCSASDGGGGRVQWAVVWKRISPDGELLPV